MGVDHATIIRRIDRLERSRDAKLFIRRKTGYEATEVGLRAMTLSERIGFCDLRSGHAEINGASAQLTGSVRVGAPDGFGSYFLFAAAYSSPTCTRSSTTPDRGHGPPVQPVETRSRHRHRPVHAAGGRDPGRKLLDYRLYLYASKAYLAARRKFATSPICLSIA